MKKSVWYFYDDDDDDDGNDAGDCRLFCIFVQPICFLHFTKSSLEEYFSIQYYLRYLYHTLSLYIVWKYFWVQTSIQPSSPLMEKLHFSQFLSDPSLINLMHWLMPWRLDWRGYMTRLKCKIGSSRKERQKRACCDISWAKFPENLFKLIMTPGDWFHT